MSPEPIFMHLDSTYKQAMAHLNRDFDAAKYCRSSVRPRRERQRAKDLSRMQVRRLVILVDESQNVEFFPAPGCRLFDGLCVCDMGVYVGVHA